MPEHLRIQVIDKRDSVDASAFVDALSACLEALNAIETQLARSSEPQTIWRINDASKNSPLQATLVGDDKKSKLPFASRLIAQTLVAGLASLNAIDATPQADMLGNKALQAILRFSKLAPKGVAVRFSSHGIEASVDRNTIRNARAICIARESRTAKCEDVGTVEGFLSVLSGKGDSVRFSLEESLTGQTVSCFFRKDLIPQVQPRWRRRVSVTGLVRRSLSDGTVTSIDVQSITDLEPPSIDWRNVPALNLTNGMESSAYIRQLRDEE